MRRSLLFSLPAFVLVQACSDGAQAPVEPVDGQEPAPLFMAQGEGISGQYLVVLKEGADPQRVLSVARARPLQVYTEAVNGFAAVLSSAQVEAIRRMEAVEFVEQDQVVRASVTQPIPETHAWGLDRIDQRLRPLSRTYTYNGTGAGVNVYVLDTGIEPTHAEFAGASGSRAQALYDGLGGTGVDCHGHGTHVAGTIGGVNVGVAKSANLLGMRVLDCTGSGTNSGIAAALDWLAVNRVTPAVANLSLGGGYSKVVNVAIDRVFSAGVFVVAAAGNDAGYSCDVSPASALGAFTVAAADSADRRATFSNWGRCVSMYAPGVSILSSYLNGQYAFASGTSMAAPHVAGVAALYLQKFPTSRATAVRNFLISNATTERVRSNDAGTIMYGTPNRMLYTNGL